MNTRILLIDRSSGPLRQYRDALLARSSDWQVDTVTDPLEAYVYIAAQAPTIVIASYHLDGEVNGIETLREIERLQPETQRFIVASEDERSTIAPWLGSACLFLPKPCPLQRLVSEIKRCIAIEKWLGNPRVKQLVAKVDKFPSLPTVYLQIVETLIDPQASAADLANVISGDVAIVAKLLQLANSAYYGFDPKVTDIKQAVSFIGIRSVRDLVLAIKVFGDFGKSDEQREQISQVLGHSIGVAVAAKRATLAETGDEAASEEAYTAGLLHDIGRLLLITTVPRQFRESRALARERGIADWEAENALIGCNHAELGAYLLARWGMPASVVESTARHHEPIDNAGGTFSPLAAVHVANALEWERVPAKSSRPDARCNERFLAEIGRLERVDYWRELVRMTSEDAEKELAGAKTTKQEPEATPEDTKGFFATLSARFGRRRAVDVQ